MKNNKQKQLASRHALPHPHSGPPYNAPTSPPTLHNDTALWNSMIEPVGSKRTSWVPGESIQCPSKEHPFLYTNKNSGL